MLTSLPRTAAAQFRDPLPPTAAFALEDGFLYLAAANLSSVPDIQHITASLFHNGVQLARPVSSVLLYRNALTEVPVGWFVRRGLAQSLTRLDLSFNRLAVLPCEIAMLSALRTLDVRCNQLTTLPAELGQLNQLAVLDLQYNRIFTVPDCLTRCVSLERVELAGNTLNVVTEIVWRQPREHTLDLSAMRLSHVLVEPFPMSHLTQLLINDNQLVALPQEIALLSRLRVLDLRQNALVTLPWQLGQLTCLTSLQLTNNPLNMLPAAVRALLTREDAPAELLRAVLLLKNSTKAFNRCRYISLPYVHSNFLL